MQPIRRARGATLHINRTQMNDIHVSFHHAITIGLQLIELWGKPLRAFQKVRRLMVRYSLWIHGN